MKVIYSGMYIIMMLNVLFWYPHKYNIFLKSFHLPLEKHTKLMTYS